MRNRWPLVSNTECCGLEQTATYSDVSCKNIRRFGRAGSELKNIDLRSIEPLPTNQVVGGSNPSGRANSHKTFSTAVRDGRVSGRFEPPTEDKRVRQRRAAALNARRAAVCLAWRTYLEVKVLYTPDKGKC